uniref:Uncharacterized mitochondrial protein AtMg00810-like n=1 Tax=Nicotiana tabacum TaxID=4097 RepID=A0A1S4BTB7_TOBAC
SRCQSSLRCAAVVRELTFSPGDSEVALLAFVGLASLLSAFHVLLSFVAPQIQVPAVHPAVAVQPGVVAQTNEGAIQVSEQLMVCNSSQGADLQSTRLRGSLAGVRRPGVSSISFSCPVVIYDILLTGDDLEEIQHIKGFLNSELKVKNLGDIHYFVRTEILREREYFIVSQRRFTLDMLHEFDVSHLSRVNSPLDPSSKLKGHDGHPLQNPTIFRHLVGKLNYLTNTCPDLSFAVLTLSQYIQRPYKSHFSAALRVLKYLGYDPGQGNLLSAEHPFSLLAFCDTDWASCKDSRRFVSGFFITLGGAPISRKSKK